MTGAHHPRTLYDDQDQRAARIFRDLETDRRAHDDRVRGDPVVHGREPVPHSVAVHRSTLSARGAANHKPVVNPSAVAQGPSTAPFQVVLRRGGVRTGASVGRYGQGAV